MPTTLTMIPDMALNDWKYDFLNCSLLGFIISWSKVSGKIQTDIKPAI